MLEESVRSDRRNLDTEYTGFFVSCRTMEFEREPFNNASEVFDSELPEILPEIESILSEIDYQVKYTHQKGRENELIFDPIGANRVLREWFTEQGWQTEVNLAQPGYDRGKDIDIAKGNVAGEIQFGNFAYLDADCNRLQRLYDGRLNLETGADIQAGVIIVVKQEMPTSNSVSHFQQATRRAAPVALVSSFTCPECGTQVSTGMPTMIYGIEPPNTGEQVQFNEYDGQRSRTLIDQKEIPFQKTYVE